MPEQRRHREPVGERPDHRRFGERLDVPEPSLMAGHRRRERTRLRRAGADRARPLSSAAGRGLAGRRGARSGRYASARTIPAHGPAHHSAGDSLPSARRACRGATLLRWPRPRPRRATCSTSTTAPAPCCGPTIETVTRCRAGGSTRSSGTGTACSQRGGGRRSTSIVRGPNWRPCSPVSGRAECFPTSCSTDPIPATFRARSGGAWATCRRHRASPSRR